MIAALDVQYAVPSATAACVLFASWTDAAPASERVASMHGPHRIPTILARADALARRGLQP